MASHLNTKPDYLGISMTTTPHVLPQIFESAQTNKQTNKTWSWGHACLRHVIGLCCFAVIGVQQQCSLGVDRCLRVRRKTHTVVVVVTLVLFGLTTSLFVRLFVCLYVCLFV